MVIFFLDLSVGPVLIFFMATASHKFEAPTGGTKAWPNHKHTHTMQNYCSKSAHSTLSTLTRWAQAIGPAVGQVISIRFKDGTKAQGRWPECKRGLSSIAGDKVSTPSHVEEVKGFDPARGNEQKFFYSHL